MAITVDCPDHFSHRAGITMEGWPVAPHGVLPSLTGGEWPGTVICTVMDVPYSLLPRRTVPSALSGVDQRRAGT